MSLEDKNKSTSSLIGDALSHVSALVRKEIDLARAEMNENIDGALMGIGLVIAAAVFLITALNVLTGALVAAITAAGLPAIWSALLVGIIFCIIAYVMATSGIAKLKLTSIAPSRAAENVKRDVEAVKEASNV